MNLFEPSFERRDGERMARLGASWLQLPGGLPERARYAGIRPEMFRAERDTSPEGGDSGRVAIRGSVETVEMLGHERIVYLRPSEPMILNTDGAGPAPAGVGLLAARLTEGPAPETGTPLTLTAPAAEIYWFDESGNAIVAQVNEDE